MLPQAADLLARAASPERARTQVEQVHGEPTAPGPCWAWARRAHSSAKHLPRNCLSAQASSLSAKLARSPVPALRSVQSWRHNSSNRRSPATAARTWGRDNRDRRRAPPPRRPKTRPLQPRRVNLRERVHSWRVEGRRQGPCQARRRRTAHRSPAFEATRRPRSRRGGPRRNTWPKPFDHAYGHSPRRTLA